MFQSVLTVLHYIMNVSFTLRWNKDNPRDGRGGRMARAITVGVPVEIDHRLNRETGQANGLAVPEADRGVFKNKLALLKRRSIEAIPIDNSIEEEERKELEMRF